MKAQVYQVFPKGTEYTKYPRRLQNRAKTKYIPSVANEAPKETKYTKYTPMKPQKEQSTTSIPKRNEVYRWRFQNRAKTKYTKYTTWSPKRNEVYQVSPEASKQSQNEVYTKCGKWSPQRNEVYQVSPNEAPKGTKYNKYPQKEGSIPTIPGGSKTKPKRSIPSMPDEAPKGTKYTKDTPMKPSKGTKYTKYPWRLQNKAKTKYIPTINHLNQ